jgi:hypothetical protein
VGRKLKRVPLDFDYPLNKVWYGYYCKPSFCHSEYSAGCEGCKEFARIKGIPLEDYGCPDFNKHFKVEPSIEPPIGEGFQLWETTSEGSPVSPVFETLDQLCEWATENATTFGPYKASEEQWKSMLDNNFVCHKEGNVIFI